MPIKLDDDVKEYIVIISEIKSKEFRDHLYSWPRSPIQANNSNGYGEN